MQSLNSFYAFSATSEAGESEFTGNTQGDLLTVEVYGTATSLSLVVLGLVNFKEENYTPISGINLNGLGVVNTITEKGIYQFSIDGLSRFKFKLDEIDGGTVTVYYRTTKGV